MIKQPLTPEFITEEYGIRLRRVYPNSSINEVIPFESSWGIIDPYQSTEPHSHDESETFYIAIGQGLMIIDEEQSDVKVGDVVFIPPNSIHQLKNTSETELRFIAIWWNGGSRK